MGSSFVFALVLVATSALTALAALLIATALGRAQKRPATVDLGNNRLDAVFLFNNVELIDANDRGEALMRSLTTDKDGPDITAWQRLSRFLAAGFPEMSTEMVRLAEEGRLSMDAVDDSGLRLTAEWLDGTARLTLSDTKAEEGSVIMDRLSHRALEEELVLLRRITEQSPILTWREDEKGQVIWANGAYLRLLGDVQTGETIGWPLPNLFPTGEAVVDQRVGLPCGPTGQERWFDLTRTTEDKGQMVFAMPADDAYRAEKTKGEFIQTLTKTFATLPIGLAVFDRTRRLQLFNPALTDLTGLEPEFLLSRPGLEGFLNRMRNKRVLPEPRDYQAWSRRLIDIEKGGDTAEFEETWTQPSGQTYRVSASPHPDGALAFLIEDITADMQLSRNVRAEMETSQSALDMLESGVAVFAPSGQLILTNEAFGQLWAFEDVDSLAGFTLEEALDNWREVSAETPLWDEIATLVQSRATAELDGIMELDDGEALFVRAGQAPNGTLMIRFDDLPRSDFRSTRPLAQPNPTENDQVDTAEPERAPSLASPLPEAFSERALRRSVSGRRGSVLRASA